MLELLHHAPATVSGELQGEVAPGITEIDTVCMTYCRCYSVSEFTRESGTNQSARAYSKIAGVRIREDGGETIVLRASFGFPVHSRHPVHSS